MKNYTAYVGSYSCTRKAEGITIFDADVERGSFKKRAEVGVDNASDIAVSSSRRIFYAVEDYDVVAFRTLPDGGLVCVLSKKVNNIWLYYICVDQGGKHLYTSDYHDGGLTILRLDLNGVIGPIVDKVYHKGLGSIVGHGSRVHIIYSKPIRDMYSVMSTDPGIDQAGVYRFTGRPGEIRPVDVTWTACGSSPYFFTLSRDNCFLYLLSDMTNAIGVYHHVVSEDRGMPEFTKPQATCTTGNNAPGSLNAATCTTFTAHNHYTFVGNAGDNSVMLFSRDAETGPLTAEFNLPIGGEHLKDVTAFPDGQHVVSVNHESRTLSSFKVDYEKKLIATNINEIPVSQPGCYVITPIEEDA